MTHQAIKKESVLKASQSFLTVDQSDNNRMIDHMFKEQPSILEFLEYLDKAVGSEPAKEVILQLMLIFYHAIGLQKIELDKIPFGDFADSLSQSAEMKNYFHNPNHSFDDDSFKKFFEDYPQKEILNYTHFAVNEQFKHHIANEQEGLLIFYILKISGDVIDQNIKR